MFSRRYHAFQLVFARFRDFLLQAEATTFRRHCRDTSLPLMRCMLVFFASSYRRRRCLSSAAAASTPLQAFAFFAFFIFTASSRGFSAFSHADFLRASFVDAAAAAAAAD